MMIRSVHFVILFLFLNNVAVGDDFFQILDEMSERDLSYKGHTAYHDASVEKTFAGKMAFLPSVTLQHKTTRDFNSDSTTKNLLLSSSLNLFRFGADWASMQSDRSNQNYWKWKTQDEYLKGQGRYAKLLFQLIKEQESVKIQKKMLEIKKKALSIGKVRYKRGLIPEQETLKLQVDIENMRARLENGTSTLIELESSLKEYLGRKFSIDRWPWVNEFNLELAQKFSSLKAPLESRPDIQSYQSLISKEKYLLKSLKRDFWPRLDMTYYLGKSYYDSGATLDSSSVLLTISMPIFENFSDTSRIQDQLAVFKNAKYSLEMIKRDIRSDWESAKANLVTQWKTAQAREKTLQLSQRLYQDNEKRFQKGRISVNELFVDQTRLLESENLVAEGWYSFHLELTNFCLLRGLQLKSCLKL